MANVNDGFGLDAWEASESEIHVLEGSFRHAARRDASPRPPLGLRAPVSAADQGISPMPAARIGANLAGFRQQLPQTLKPAGEIGFNIATHGRIVLTEPRYQARFPISPNSRR